ncbi:hypothetical protein [Streptomyces albireticuli]|uniref:hypothetical protein n=1 Tax=Streptomyces albireticuli TaxID=1940 RepID=UPI0036960758
MRTFEEIESAIDAVPWDDARPCARTCREILSALADDRPLLTAMVERTGRDPRLLARCESHPIVSRLCLAQHPGNRWQLRLHVFRDDEKDIVPHDHKYPFAVHVLAGGYAHAWNRRTGTAQSGDFASTGITPALVTLETAHAAYLLSDTLIHQTVIARGTVTLFLRGPVRQDRWHAATDMLDQLNGFQAPPADGSAYLGSTPLAREQYDALTHTLAQRGITRRTTS